MNRWMNRAISNAFNKWREVYQEEIMLKKMKVLAGRLTPHSLPIQCSDSQSLSLRRVHIPCL